MLKLLHLAGMNDVILKGGRQLCNGCQCQWKGRSARWVATADRAWACVGTERALPRAVSSPQACRRTARPYSLLYTTPGGRRSPTYSLLPLYLYLHFACGLGSRVRFPDPRHGRSEQHSLSVGQPRRDRPKQLLGLERAQLGCP